MNISSNSYGFKLLQSAQIRQQNASSAIATLGSTNNANSSELDSLAESLIELKKAEHEASAGAKIIETDKKMLGTILDIRA